MKNASLLITGTDTGVGKTFIASSLARHFSVAGLDIGVMKPVESGCITDPEDEERLLPLDSMALMAAAGVSDPLDTVNPYRFAEPLSPNIAARLNNTTVELDVIMERYKRLSETHEAVIVEGAGGFLTPISDTMTVADLAVQLRLPVLIIAASRLGCINATLLTIEAVLARGLTVAGVLLNTPAPLEAGDRSHAHNLDEIKRFSAAPILGAIDFTSRGVAQEFGERIDVSGLLTESRAD